MTKPLCSRPIQQVVTSLFVLTASITAADSIPKVAAQEIGGELAQSSKGAEIGVYSGRHYNTDKELYKQFTAKTGIKVRLLEGKDDALIERLRTEGSRSEADVLVLVDAARLDRATDLGLFRPTRSAALNRDVPTNLRDSRGRWYALTRRVRIVVVNPKRVNPATIRTYADLAKPALKGQLCLRNRQSPYNQSLVADQMIQRGEASTRAWIKGMTNNVTQTFFSSDTPLVRAVANGECGVGVVNTYYVARMLSGESGEADKALAQRVKVVFPNPAHVNISGGGVTTASKNPAAALKLLEFLASTSGGRGYAEANHEYPLKGYGDSATLKRMGSFRADNVSAEQLGLKSRGAVALMERNGWK